MRVFVASPQSSEVQHAHATEFAQLDGGGRGHDRVHWGTDDGHREVEGINLPVQRHVFGVTGSTGRHDGHCVQGHRLSTAFASANFNLITHVYPVSIRSRMGYSAWKGSPTSYLGAVVWCFYRHHDVVWVGFFESRGGDANKPAVALQGLDVR